jgi:hypothetical protein
VDTAVLDLDAARERIVDLDRDDSHRAVRSGSLAG